MRSFTKEVPESRVVVQTLRKYVRETRALIGPMNPDVVNSALARIAREAEDRALEIDRKIHARAEAEDRALQLDRKPATKLPAEAVPAQVAA